MIQNVQHLFLWWEWEVHISISESQVNNTQHKNQEGNIQFISMKKVKKSNVIWMNKNNGWGIWAWGQINNQAMRETPQPFSPTGQESKVSQLGGDNRDQCTYMLREACGLLVFYANYLGCFYVPSKHITIQW